MLRSVTRILTVASATALVARGTALPADHMATAADVAARLRAAEQSRAADLKQLDEFLGSASGLAAAKLAGARAADARSPVAFLSDAEARDLAARVRALRSDPVSGTLSYNEKLLLVVGVVYYVSSALFTWAFLTHGP